MGAPTWKQYFIYQADYQHWANEVLFECLDRLDPKALAEPQGLHFSTIHQTVDHILVVSQLWRLRLQGESPIVDYKRLHHPDWRALKTALRQEMRGLQHWLETKPEAFFESEIAFRSSEGKARRNWVRDVLTHMMGHMVHHRGQVSAAATRLGTPAPEMDYIFYKRAVDAALTQKK
ncbi:MAG: hypothetical protein EFKGCFLK_00303 [Rhodocyclaceae bacterium]|nr:MAG: hypothetical protein F9K21_11095 [Rhodocyclaceae bacterium]MBE7423165.1 DinB family protein [Zoogloeaceae bacterium]MBV6406756.1 hypothetical protein [Rhodocyclaceae bacterium]MCK6384580.1 DinB family protein [Rhodocyclaceae bacterium]CAG0931063.1 hypothetical protein RHDC3_01743 [Rhodocyclaceae bacterium]